MSRVVSTDKDVTVLGAKIEVDAQIAVHEVGRDTSEQGPFWETVRWTCW